MQSDLERKIKCSCIFSSPPAPYFAFLRLNLQHMEVPRLGVEWELQLLAYITATATATWDLSLIYNLPHSSWQCQIPGPLGEARHPACLIMNTSQICFCCATMFMCSCIFQVIFFFFWLYLQHMEFPGPGIKPVPQLQTVLQLWRHQILSLLCATRKRL